MKTYTPSPLNTENITLPDNLTELTEAMARNVHEVWALGRGKKDGNTERHAMMN